MYNRKIAPTISKIKKEIEDTIKISKSTLTLTLLDLGYRYKKSEDIYRLQLYTQNCKICQQPCMFFNQIIWGIKWSSPGLLKLKKLE
jgi:hypothetical protein